MTNTTKKPRKFMRTLVILSLLPFQQVVEPGKRVTLRAFLYTLRVNPDRNPDTGKLKLGDIDLHLLSFDWLSCFEGDCALLKKLKRKSG